MWRKQTDGSYRLDDVWTVRTCTVTGKWYAMRGGMPCLAKFTDVADVMNEAETLVEEDKLYK